MRSLLELQRQIRELKKKFAPPPSPPDSAQALNAELWSTWMLNILFHSHGWKHSSDGPEEILRLLGIPEVVKWNWNVPGVKDAIDKRQDLVERRGGKWPDDETKLVFNYELRSLYYEVLAELRNTYRLPREYTDFYSRVEALVKQVGIYS